MSQPPPLRPFSKKGFALACACCRSGHRLVGDRMVSPSRLLKKYC